MTTLETVIHEIASVLAIPKESISAETPLWELPGFDSFRLVEMVDRLEQVTGRQMPVDYRGADLRDASGIARLFTSPDGDHL